MGCKVIGPFLLAMSQASLPGLLFLVTCHHVIPNEADSISLYPKSKHCTTEPEKVGDMEWQYYDAFSCVGHLHSRHLHFRGATLVIHKWSAVAVVPCAAWVLAFARQSLSLPRVLFWSHAWVFGALSCLMSGCSSLCFGISIDMGHSLDRLDIG